MARLRELQDIQLRLSDPRRVNGAADLERLLDQGKTVVLITHGIHATEVGGSQMAAHFLYRLATSNEPPLREILDNVVLWLVPSLNPDGVAIVTNWYNTHSGTPRRDASRPSFTTTTSGTTTTATGTRSQPGRDAADGRQHPQRVAPADRPRHPPAGLERARACFCRRSSIRRSRMCRTIVEGYERARQRMAAADLRSEGFQGITTNSHLRRWTPAARTRTTTAACAS